MIVPRPAPSQPTEVELQILEALWEHGPSTVREVHNALAARREVGYSTTLKMLQVMLEKGLVQRDERVRPQVYRASRTRQRTQLQLLDDLLQRAFGGSARRLVMRMASAGRISAEDLAEIQQLIDEAKEQES